jgi:molybdopterin converting factor small subunit|tara:strand:+ start:156 stop:434 length:279 start_codon:yes stop_codon:yes gene_type:complete
VINITVEFFGIPRQRTGEAEASVSLGNDQGTLAGLLHQLSRDFTDFGDTCVVDGQLDPLYIANRDGEEFLTDPASTLKDGDRILILSSDAGG